MTLTGLRLKQSGETSGKKTKTLKQIQMISQKNHYSVLSISKLTTTHWTWKNLHIQMFMQDFTG